jgi:hypothetical protein
MADLLPQPQKLRVFQQFADAGQVSQQVGGHGVVLASVGGAKGGSGAFYQPGEHPPLGA